MSFRIGQTLVFKDENSISWTGGLEVDGDGSPFCYAPANSGLPALDFLANAGKPGGWYGLACDDSGVPYIQGSEDPAPGYYVSTSALQDKTKNESDPRRYLNAQTVPFIAVPPELLHAGVQLGDLVQVSHGTQRRMALVGDVCPKGHLSEGSIALAIALGVPSSPKNGGVSMGVEYRILLGTASKPPWPRPLPLTA